MPKLTSHETSTNLSACLPYSYSASSMLNEVCFYGYYIVWAGKGSDLLGEPADNVGESMSTMHEHFAVCFPFAVVDVVARTSSVDEILERVWCAENGVLLCEVESCLVPILQIVDLFGPEDVRAPIEIAAKGIGSSELARNKVAHQKLDGRADALVDKVGADKWNPQLKTYGIDKAASSNPRAQRLEQPAVYQRAVRMRQHIQLLPATLCNYTSESRRSLMMSKGLEEMRRKNVLRDVRLQ